VTSDTCPHGVINAVFGHLGEVRLSPKNRYGRGHSIRQRCARNGHGDFVVIDRHISRSSSSFIGSFLSYITLKALSDVMVRHFATRWPSSGRAA
jgi:hypothetical protein